MSSQLQQLADIITRAAGWKNAVPDEHGIFRFSLEGDLDFSLLTPENRTAVLLADLGIAPERGSAPEEETLLRLASLAASSLKKRRSSLSLANGRIELHRALPITLNDEYELRTEVRDFLNDLAWWKKQISGSSTQSSSKASSSPFSLGSWFSG